MGKPCKWTDGRDKALNKWMWFLMGVASGITLSGITIIMTSPVKLFGAI